MNAVLALLAIGSPLIILLVLEAVALVSLRFATFLDRLFS